MVKLFDASDMFTQMQVENEELRKEEEMVEEIKAERTQKEDEVRKSTITKENLEMTKLASEQLREFAEGGADTFILGMTQGLVRSQFDELAIGLDFSSTGVSSPEIRRELMQIVINELYSLAYGLEYIIEETTED